MMPDPGLKSVFTIGWTGDCPYILHTPRHYFMEQLMPPESDIMDTVFVTIDQVKAKGYHYSAFRSATPEFVVDGWINVEK